MGVIIVLLFDSGDCAALQRKVASGEAAETKWATVNLPPTTMVPNDPIFVVNIADCLSELSQNYLPSTLHRVMSEETALPFCSTRTTRDFDIR
jgi:isopenicillin N synthase-like dioxygenase